MRFKSNHDKVCLQQKNSCKHASDSQIFPQNKLFCFPKTEEFALNKNRVVPLSTKQTNRCPSSRPRYFHLVTL